MCAAVVLVAATGMRADAGGTGYGGPSLVDSETCAESPDFTCSWLTVPLDRSRRHGQKLRLHVAVETEAHAPRGVLLMLTGGPGQPGVGLLPRIKQRISYLLGDYRLVMIDQRGTGAGAINCPRLQTEAGFSDIAPPSPEAVAECAAILGETRNFYTTADTVADLEDLRKAMGVRRWTVDGVSYGAFAGAQYGLRHPASIDKLVLDSVVPKDGIQTLYQDSLAHVTWMLREACREQNCGYDPAEDLKTVLAREDIAVGFWDFIVIASIVDPKLTGAGFYPVLLLLHLAAQGNATPLKESIAQLQAGDPPPAEYSAGLHIATICADLEDAPWGDASAPLAGRQQALRRAVAAVPEASVWPFPRETLGEQAIASACAHWPPSRPNPEPRLRLLTMPVLLLAGDRDLSTPAKWARELAASTPRSTLVVVAGMGHGLQGRNAEADAAVRAFLLG
jgi:pimeloyl-ACP methyl ester carboxylesterase